MGTGDDSVDKILLVSIIMPVFNRATVIGASVKSVLDQQYASWELIIVDDGSDDDTFTIASELALHEPRMHVVKRKSNVKGGNSCRNEGMKMAMGDYIIFLDSDDLLLSGCLYRRVNTINDFPQLDVLIFQGAVFTSDPAMPAVYWNIETNRNIIERFFLFDGPWQTSGAIWKSSFLYEYALQWDESLFLWQDIDFHIQALLRKPAYEIFWQLPFDYLVKSGSPDSLSRKDYDNPAKLNSRIYFWNKYSALHDDNGNFLPDPKFLKPLLLNILKIYAVKKEWEKYRSLNKEGLIKNILTKEEFKNVKRNALWAGITGNRLKNFSFPDNKVKAIFDKAISATLQKIPLKD